MRRERQINGPVLILGASLLFWAVLAGVFAARKGAEQLRAFNERVEQRLHDAHACQPGGCEWEDN